MGTQWGALSPLVPTNMGEALSAEAFLSSTASWFTLEHHDEHIDLLFWGVFGVSVTEKRK